MKIRVPSYTSLLLIMAVYPFLTGCDKFEYSPYQTKIQDLPHDLNNKNITQLLSQETGSKDTLRFIFTGDSQRFYDELENLVDKANSLPKIDFLVLAGDISDFGLLQEFLWVNERLDKLSFPYLAVIGNHDLIANGSEIYQKIFGEKNFSFVYKNYKFIFHDTNGREYSFKGHVPDLHWLDQELKGNHNQWMIGVSHIPPYNGDFDSALEIPYKNMLSSHPNYILNLNGHLHGAGDSFYYNDHVRYINSNSVEKNSFIVLEIVEGEIVSKNFVEY